MTCIAAIVDNGKIYMAADSAVTYPPSSRLVEGVAKIARKKVGYEEYLIGISGKLRMIQIGLYKAELPPPPPKNATDETVMAWLIGEVCAGIRLLLKTEVDLQQSKPEEEMSALPGRILLGLRQRLYVIDEDLTALQLSENYGAIGSGAAHANGVLFATESLEPQARLQKALEAAEHWNSNVRRPFNFLEL